MFGFGNNNSPASPTPAQAAPAPAAVPATPQGAPAQAAPTGAPSTPGAPQLQTPPTAPVQAAPATPATPATPAPVNILEVLMQPSTEAAPLTPEDRANNFVTAMMSQAAPDPNANAAPALNAEKLLEQLPNLGLGNNIDYTATLEAINGENGAEEFGKVIAQSQQNTIMAMVPFINAVVAASAEAAQQSAITESHHSLTSSAIVNAFTQQHPYGGSPAIQESVRSMANMIAANPASRETPMPEIVAKLHEIYQGMGASIFGGMPAQNGNQVNNGAVTDMSDIFK